MSNINPEQLDDLFEKSASVIRSQNGTIRELRAKVAAYEQNDAVTKLAADLSHQGLLEEGDAQKFVSGLVEQDIPLDMARTFFNHTAPGLALDMSKVAGDDDYSNSGASPEDRLTSAILSTQSQ